MEVSRKIAFQALCQADKRRASVLFVTAGSGIYVNVPSAKRYTYGAHSGIDSEAERVIDGVVYGVSAKEV